MVPAPAALPGSRRDRCHETPAFERIATLTGKTVTTPTRYSVQVGENEHIDPPETAGIEDLISEHAWRYMNHACEPNAAFRGRDLFEAIADARVHVGASENDGPATQ